MRALRFRNHVQNGHDLCKGQNRVDVQGGYINVEVYGSMLQYFAVRCSVLQCILGEWTLCSTYTNGAVCCSELHCVAGCWREM